MHDWAVTATIAEPYMRSTESVTRRRDGDCDAAAWWEHAGSVADGLAPWTVLSTVKRPQQVRILPASFELWSVV
jgi:hypothetical protein